MVWSARPGARRARSDDRRVEITAGMLPLQSTSLSRSANLARSNSRLAGKSKTPAAGFAQPVLMSNINPNCDGSHCRHGYKEVRQYPLGSGGDPSLSVPAVLPPTSHAAAITAPSRFSRSTDWPQVDWSTAEVVYDSSTASRSTERRRWAGDRRLSCQLTSKTSVRVAGDPLNSSSPCPLARQPCAGPP